MTETVLEYSPDPVVATARLHAAASISDCAVVDMTGMIFAFRHRDVERLLHDTRLEGVGLTLFDLLGVPDGPLRDWYGGLMFTNEGAVHHRLRRLVSKAFTPRSVERLRGLAGRMADDRLARLAQFDGDLIAAFGGLPMQVMCALLGVPDSAVEDFIEWTDALSAVFGLMSPEQVAAASGAIDPLLAYVADVVEHRSHTPADDLISALVAAEDDGERLTRDETVAMAVNLLAGGHDTTASQIGCSLFTLLQQPDVMRLATADSTTIGSIVNETIRLEPSLPGAPRTVIEPVEIGGIERPVGSLVLLATATANRDPSVWSDPDVFVPTRFIEAGGPRLLTFGAGPHYCLGTALARMTLEETVRAVAPRQPVLQMDPSTIPWVSALGRSPVTLPVLLEG